MSDLSALQRLAEIEQQGTRPIVAQATASRSSSAMSINPPSSNASWKTRAVLQPPQGSQDRAMTSDEDEEGDDDDDEEDDDFEELAAAIILRLDSIIRIGYNNQVAISGVASILALLTTYMTRDIPTDSDEKTKQFLGAIKEELMEINRNEHDTQIAASLYREQNDGEEEKK